MPRTRGAWTHKKWVSPAPASKSSRKLTKASLNPTLGPLDKRRKNKAQSPKSLSKTFLRISNQTWSLTVLSQSKTRVNRLISGMGLTTMTSSQLEQISWGLAPKKPMSCWHFKMISSNWSIRKSDTRKIWASNLTIRLQRSLNRMGWKRWRSALSKWT